MLVAEDVKNFPFDTGSQHIEINHGFDTRHVYRIWHALVTKDRFLEEKTSFKESNFRT